MNRPSPEDLLGYLLGALDAREQRQVQQALEREPDLEEELLALKARLAPLELAGFDWHFPPNSRRGATGYGATSRGADPNFGAESSDPSEFWFLFGEFPATVDDAAINDDATDDDSINEAATDNDKADSGGGSPSFSATSRGRDSTSDRAAGDRAAGDRAAGDRAAGDRAAGISFGSSLSGGAGFSGGLGFPVGLARRTCQVIAATARGHGNFFDRVDSVPPENTGRSENNLSAENGFASRQQLPIHEVSANRVSAHQVSTVKSPAGNESLATSTESFSSIRNLAGGLSATGMSVTGMSCTGMSVTGMPRTLSFSDFLVAVIAACCLGSLIFPAIIHSRFQQRMLACQANMTKIYQGLVAYAESHDGHFVEIPSQGPLAAAGAFAPILKEAGWIRDDQIFSCAGVGDRQVPVQVPSFADLNSSLGSPALVSPALGSPALATNLERNTRGWGLKPEGAVSQGPAYGVQSKSQVLRADLRSVLSGDYGYSLGYWHDGQHETLGASEGVLCVLVADSPHQADPLRLTRNHEGYGTNALLIDGSVQFLPLAVLGEDRIYENDWGAVAPGARAGDSVVAAGWVPFSFPVNLPSAIAH